MQTQNNFLALVNEYRAHIQECDIHRVKQQLEQQDNFTLIDVREDCEWNQGHIPTAIHISKGIIERDIEKYIPNRTASIVLYCGGGFRSILSAYNLQKMGYCNVISMDGGMKDWLNDGNKITI